MEESNITIKDLIKQTLDTKDLLADQKVTIISDLCKLSNQEIHVIEKWCPQIPVPNQIQPYPIQPYPMLPQSPWYTTCSAEGPGTSYNVNRDDIKPS